MKYILYQIWKFSLNYGLTWLSSRLTGIIKLFWIIPLYPYTDNLPHNVKTFKGSSIVEFTFDLETLGILSPKLLTNVYYTIIFSEHTFLRCRHIAIMLTVNYDGDIKSLGGHFITTQFSTAEDFVNHYLHLTNKDGHGESKVVLANAQILKVKVFQVKV